MAQSQVSVGMGLLAGSTVMLLTLIWGTCVIVGKCDLQDSVAIDLQDTKGFSLTGMSFCFHTIYLCHMLSLIYPKKLQGVCLCSCMPRVRATTIFTGQLLGCVTFGLCFLCCSNKDIKIYKDKDMFFTL